MMATTVYTFSLLVLYLALILLYLITPPKRIPVPPWPPISLSSNPPVATVVPCQSDSDCNPSDRVCLVDTHLCAPPLLKEARCNPETGVWTSYANTPFAICSCLDPGLFDQNYFGGDCTVSVACGVHGQYDPVSRACHCDTGYRAAQDLTCQKLSVMENPAACGPDELSTLDSRSHVYFHADYLISIRPARCVKRPCSFDALSGRRLKHGRFKPDWGCVCDPTYGLLGVNVGKARYLKTPGFDACASLLVQDPPYPVPVKVVTTFYLNAHEPVSLILWEALEEATLVPLLRSTARGLPLRSWLVHQAPWRYDFAQDFFKSQRTFRARVRKRVGVFPKSREVDHVRTDFEPPDCHTLFSALPQAVVDAPTAHRVLYENPVCRISEDDPVAEPRFLIKDKVL